MDENLMNSMPEDEIVDLPMEDVGADIATEEIVPTIVIEPEEEVVIDIGESIGWVSGDDRYHDSLLGVDFPRQHPIEAITNLREELNEIERLKTVYSDKFNVANYYKWKDAAYDTYGYFVSIVESDKIKLCNGEAIFGVVVKGGELPDAGFIGGQDVVSRDNTYGLVVTSGLVDVLCELDVNTGDFVVSNSSGYAKKSESNYGYRVLGTETKNGIPYAIIALGVQADVTNDLGVYLNEVEQRVGVNEKNIISAINVANQAYNKASEVNTSNQIMSDKVDGVLGTVDKVVSDVENLGSQVSNSALISAQAKAIAESAATSAESMRKEADEKAKEALAETSELRKDLEATAAEIDTDLENAALELEAAKESINTIKDGLQEQIDETVERLNGTEEDLKNTRDDLQNNIDQTVSDIEDLVKDLEPLVAWPEGSVAEDATGVAGFVARANKDSATIASIVTWQGETNTAIAGFKQEVADTYATIESVTKLETDTSTAIAGVKQEASEKYATIESVAKLETDTANSISGLKQEVTDTYATSESVASFKTETSDAIAGVKQTADANKAELDLMASYDKEGNSALAGITTYVDENSAQISQLSKYEQKDKDGNIVNSGAAGLIAQVDANKSSISLLAGYDGDIAGLKAQVDENTSSLTTLASQTIGDYVSMDTWDETKATAGTIYYVEDTRKYYYYDNGWKETDKPYEAGLSGALAGIQQTADDNAASIEMITSFEGDFGESLSGFVSEATAENAEIKALAVYGYTDDDGTKHYGAAGIMSEVDKNKSAIEAIAGKDGSIAGLQAQVDDNKAEVDLIARRVDSTYESVDTWNVTDKDTNVVYYAKDTKYYWYYTDDAWKKTYSASEAGLSSAIAGLQIQTDENSSKINSLASWQDDTNIAMARIEQKADANGAYIQSTVSNMDKYAVGPHSQAYGFTRKQAESVLEVGMIYVPTEDGITEKYIGDGDLPTYERTFSKTYLYRWGEVSDGYGWITVDANYSATELNTSAPSVFFSHLIAPSMSDMSEHGYWYTDGDTSSGTAADYESYTLYKWSEYTTKNDDGSEVAEKCWTPVATLAGNSQNRAVSQIRQDANSIDLRVTDTETNYAGLRGDLTATNATVQTVASWKSKVEGDVSNIATIKSTADNASASIAQVVEAVGKDGKVNAASIVTAVNSAGSSVVIEANHLNLNGYVTISSLSSSGTTVIDGSRITTGLIKSSGYQYTTGTYSTSGTAISLDNGYIRSKNFAIDSSGNAYFNGVLGANTVSAITIDASQITAGELDAGKVTVKGDLSAFGATIGGFTIDDTKISNGTIGSDNSLFLSTEGMTVTISGMWYSNVRMIVGSKFVVSGDGTVFAKNANISGMLSAGAGSTIGGWTVSSPNGYVFGKMSTKKSDVTDSNGNSLKYGIGFDTNSVGTTNRAFAIGPLGGIQESSSWEKATFYVTGQGKLCASDANITGTITANDGHIGNVQITTTGLGVENEDGNSYITSTGIGAYKGMFNVGSIGGWTFGDYSLTGNYYILNSGTVSYLTNIASTQTLYYSQLLPDKLVTKEKFASVTAQQYIEWGTLTNITFDSDERLKNSIENFSNEYDVFFDMLQPKRYKYNDGTSNRYHTGYIAQEVVKSLEESGLSTFDFAAVMLRYPGTEREKWQLRRDEFVALNTWQIQKLKARVAELENKIELLTSKNE